MGRIKLFDKEFFFRTASALILVPLVIAIIINGGGPLNALVIILTILMSYEWNELVSKSAKVRLWQLIGIIYITVPMVSLLWISSTIDGSRWIIALLIVVWSTDIGGYLVGRTVGGIKLVPSISPNKTWSGFLGGIFLALITSNIMKEFSLIYIVLLSITAQISDLLESKIKRIFNVSDSGNMIPGHGGILDTVDGLVLSVPLLLVIKVF
jgi:phosphatidate cytidylyltransferase